MQEARPSPPGEIVRLAGGGSLHDQILEALRDKIISGQWPPGHRIPSEVELTETFRCSRMTVNKALTQLAQGGLIERRRKAGSFVARPRAQSAIMHIQSIPEEVQGLGLPYRFEISRRRVRGFKVDDASRLGEWPDLRLLDVTTVHFAGAQPFCLEERLINLAIAPQAEEEPFSELPPGSWLIATTAWTDAEHRIRSEAVDDKRAIALGLSRGAPVLVIERRTWRAAVPVTHVRLTYPGNAREVVAQFSAR